MNVATWSFPSDKCLHSSKDDHRGNVYTTRRPHMQVIPPGWQRCRAHGERLFRHRVLISRMRDHDPA
jgi:hypothetical protein